MRKIDYVMVITLIALFVLGWCSSNLYRELKVEKQYLDKTYDGLWIPNDSMNQTDALKTAYDYDSVGDWVCVNINQMSIERMIQVCEHEVAHEIFAEKCQGNATRCLEKIS